jgi:hypothetical protein
LYPPLVLVGESKENDAVAQADVSEDKTQARGAVDVGNAAHGRVCHAFEDATDGCGIERGGNENGGASEGKPLGCEAEVPQEAICEPAAH